MEALKTWLGLSKLPTILHSCKVSVYDGISSPVLQTLANPEEMGKRGGLSGLSDNLD
jgi:hypothetical protein